MAPKSPHPAFGHLLPFFEREKELDCYPLRPLSEAKWKKVAKGRMRALGPAHPFSHSGSRSQTSSKLFPGPLRSTMMKRLLLRRTSNG